MTVSVFEPMEKPGRVSHRCWIWESLENVPSVFQNKRCHVLPVSVFVCGCEAWPVSLWLIYHCLSNYHPWPPPCSSAPLQTGWPSPEARFSPCKLKPCKYLLWTHADTRCFQFRAPVVCDPKTATATTSSSTARVHTRNTVCTCLCCHQLWKSPPPLLISASSHCVCDVASSLLANSLPQPAPSGLYSEWQEPGFSALVLKKCCSLQEMTLTDN